MSTAVAKPRREQVALWLAVCVPFIAVCVAVPVSLSWGVSWHVMALAVLTYVLGMLGITVGFHRLFTHRSFRAARPVKIALAVAGSAAIQGPILRWVSDHREHHAFSDRHGDPHSPWRYGSDWRSLLRGIAFAHIGWMFERGPGASRARDLARDADLVRIDRWFWLIATIGLVLPSLVEVAIGARLADVMGAFLWAGLVRTFFIHHVTWSVNSVCHVVGSRPFATGDRSANVWPLALLSMGESWHNGHHASPSCARHGVLRGQVDVSATVIWTLERCGWAWDVRWPARSGYCLVGDSDALGGVESGSNQFGDRI